MKFGKTIRNNWKKSVVGAIALYYGAATAKERYEYVLFTFLIYRTIRE